MQIKPAHPGHIHIRNQAGGPGACCDCKKSSADGNVSAAYPNDFIKHLAASRTDSSSSTIEISGFLFAIGPSRSLNVLRSRGSSAGSCLANISGTLILVDYTLVYAEPAKGSCGSLRMVLRRPVGS